MRPGTGASDAREIQAPGVEYPVDHATVRRFLDLLLGAGSGCVELRVLKAACDRKGRIRRGRDLGLGPGFEGATLAGWFDDATPLLTEVRRLEGVSAYVSINPIKRDLLARSYNALARTRHATRDDDVEAISWLYLDIDPERPPDTSATDAEAEAAASRRDAILHDHPLFTNWAAWGSSGNGSWILVRLPDYPNDASHRELVRRTTSEFASLYSDNTVRVDVATANPARLIGLPGCWKAKGSNRPERPWRRATLLGIGAKLERSLARSHASSREELVASRG